MNALFLFIGWGILAVVSTIRFAVRPKYSASERARLIRQGDKEATREAEDIADAPLLASLVFVIRTLFISVFITWCAVLYGVVSGVVIGTVAVLLVPLAYRLPVVCKWADRLRDATLPWLKKAALALRPLLQWLQERDLATGDATLNSQDELLDLLRHSPGVLSHEEFGRLVASLQFDDKKVADIMTPRSMIEAIPVGETLGPLVLDELYKTGHSRFPVYKGDLDHVVGMLYLHDLLDIKQGSKPAKEAMQSKVFFIREDKGLAHALHGFLSTRHHLFVVVNSYRETVGIISLEDTVEALLGTKIQDEFDAFDDLRAVAEHNPHSNNLPKSREDI